METKSGVPGVYWSPSKKRWIAKVFLDGEQYLAGSYKDLSMAVESHAKKRKELVELFGLQNLKERPCLRCDKKIMSTPEMRICGDCKRPERTWAQSEGGLGYNPTYNRAKNTRGGT